MTIYDFITNKTNEYQKPITLEEGWDWSMKEHLRRSFLYLNSQFEENNEDRELRPNKNIVLAIANVQYRTTGFDVKDVELYVDNKDEYYKSALARKFHEKWALENQMDIFIDRVVQSYVNYGGVLVKNVGEKKPEVVDLRTIAFCNQTNILDYPFGFKHVFSQAQLRKMKNWGTAENGATIGMDEFITLATREGKDEIEVFEVYGEMPTQWIKDNDTSADY